MVVSGLESIAAREIELLLGAKITRKTDGLVTFKIDGPDPDLFDLKTTEDVFLFAWGTDSLTYRAKDLEDIRKWTAKEGDWTRLISQHHAFKPKTKGKPTYRFITQMDGEHGYHRKDAQKEFAKGLAKFIPPNWRMVEDNASVEFWLTIEEKTAVAGIRLTDKTMRHRTYKVAHRPASLRPTVAAAMVRIAELKPTHKVMDPMCGAGTILGEYQIFAEGWRVPREAAWGGDIEQAAVLDASANTRRLGKIYLHRWDARWLPLDSCSIDRIICNPPFGKQISSDVDINKLYRGLMIQFNRILSPGGKAVLLVSDYAALKGACENVGWELEKKFRTEILGQNAVISLWHKPAPEGTLSAPEGVLPVSNDSQGTE
jgi:23S rRNA G2445 N2-methylase RlmL